MVTAWNKINPSWPGKNAMCERRFKQHSDMKCAPGVHQCNPHKTKDAMGGGGGTHPPGVTVHVCIWKLLKMGTLGSSVKMRGSGASSSVKIGVSGTDFVYRTRLTGTLAGRYPRGGARAVKRPWAAGNCLSVTQTFWKWWSPERQKM